MRRPSLFTAVLAVGLVLFTAAALWVVRAPHPSTSASAADDSPLLVQTKLPEITTTSAAAPAPERTPVTPPKDPYAAEPIREIGIIEIPKIGLRHKLYHGISLRNIDMGPSHWPGSALPGETGNVVIAGHRVTHSRPFRTIHQLVVGDLVHFEVAGVRTTYAVTGSQIVAPTAMHIVDQTPTPTATLFACHPPGSARQRYVVHLGLVE
ncbi:MAG: sortase [Acidimicrobiia bacterium]